MEIRKNSGGFREIAVSRLFIYQGRWSRYIIEQYICDNLRKKRRKLDLLL